ncbi:hypothetical protein GOV04_02200 [Candidatus Woesearchaeota archaeon]|nr:hypothetical protein [Candidatus Woesearchaeota archaeon]
MESKLVQALFLLVVGVVFFVGLLFEENIKKFFRRARDIISVLSVLPFIRLFREDPDDRCEYEEG